MLLWQQPLQLSPSILFSIESKVVAFFISLILAYCYVTLGAILICFTLVDYVVS